MGASYLGTKSLAIRSTHFLYTSWTNFSMSGIVENYKNTIERIATQSSKEQDKSPDETMRKTVGAPGIFQMK